MGHRSLIVCIAFMDAPCSLRYFGEHVQGELNWPPPYPQHAGQVSDAAAGHHRGVRLAGGGRAARPLPLHLRQVQAGAPQEEAGHQGESEREDKGKHLKDFFDPATRQFTQPPELEQFTQPP